METASAILAYTQSVLFIILTVAGVFLIKLIIDVSKLTTNLDESVTILKNELEPTINELNTTLKNINAIASSADKQVDNVKKVVSKLLGLTGLMFGQVKSLSGGFLKGILAGIKLFTKK